LRLRRCARQQKRGNRQELLHDNLLSREVPVPKL
jgi:hypothetical protein